MVSMDAAGMSVLKQIRMLATDRFEVTMLTFSLTMDAKALLRSLDWDSFNAHEDTPCWFPSHA
jgi:hypothetical protein